VTRRRACLGDRVYEAVSDQEQRHATLYSSTVGDGEEDEDQDQRRFDEQTEPSLVQENAEPVAVGRKAVDGLVGQP
jgi:hypothetical protein